MEINDSSSFRHTTRHERNIGKKTAKGYTTGCNFCLLFATFFACPVLPLRLFSNWTGQCTTEDGQRHYCNIAATAMASNAWAAFVKGMRSQILEAPKPNTLVHAVVGNAASDLDSIVGSLTLAYVAPGCHFSPHKPATYMTRALSLRFLVFVRIPLFAFLYCVGCGLHLLAFRSPAPTHHSRYE